jgi:hypothetical protein
LQRLHSEKETALKQLEGEKRALADAHNALHKCELERNRYSDKCDKFEERLEREVESCLFAFI